MAAELGLLAADDDGADRADFMLLALGLNIVVGYAGLLDLGYVAFWAIGAYCVGLVVIRRSSSSATSTS